MSSLTETVAEILRTVDRPGDFFVAGTIDLPAPRLEVEGVGPLALPVLPAQAAQLVAAAERAPYGRGAETVIDTTVRRTWQIAPERVHIRGKQWPQTLEAILARVAAGFGLAKPVTAELYKLLVYDQGSFFVSHRDTEKAPGMFATLVVALPSIGTGGELLVRHKGREARLELRCDDPSEAAFAAFYADCVHEVLPVTAGCRVVLVFNLLRGGREAVPEPPDYAGQEAKLAAVLREWVLAKKAGDAQAPEKLIYPLEHAYTQAELSFAALKGADAAVAGTLVAAAPQADCELHLALMSIEESGIAEYVDTGSHRRWREEDMELEAGEVTDRSAVLKELRRPDGGASIAAELPIEDEEISPPDALDGMEPDEEDFQEATGNEGASFDRTYSRAALVLWPRERVLAVLNQQGLGATVPYLGDLADRWAASGAGQDALLWREAHELAGYILATWPEGWFGEETASSPVRRMLEHLKRLRDTERLDGLLAAIAAAGRHAKGDNEALLAALELVSPGEAATRIERIIAGTAGASPAACADLLARAVAVDAGALRAELKGAAAKLIAELPGDPARPAPAPPGRGGRSFRPASLPISSLRSQRSTRRKPPARWIIWRLGPMLTASTPC